MLTFPNALALGTEIGRGAFGVVYEGIDIVRGQVAVKVFERLPIETDAIWMSRAETLLREGQRLKDAEHARVVNVYQACASVDASAIALVMEYCQNGSLLPAYMLKPMGLKDLRDILNDVAQGLEIIHNRNMLHRDLKPSNILLGNNRRAKLGDFGLVTNDLLFGYASGAGYIDHLAPEIHTTRQTSVKTDVWAFGMTAYRLLHGNEFYSESPPAGLLIPAGDFAKNLPWLPHVPDAWRRFIRKSLHDDPTKRYQNAGELRSALAALPIDPDWISVYGPTAATWYRRDKKKTITVHWEKRTPRDHEWVATSLNLETNTSRTVGSSSGTVNKTQALNGLQAFFARSK